MIKREFSTAHERCENLDVNLRMYTCNAMKAKRNSIWGVEGGPLRGVGGERC